MKDKRITGQERLRHVLEAIESIESFVKPHSKESFLSDNLVISAVLYQFSIIGEAISNVEGDILDKHSYPWHEVKSFRNFILHEYSAIEYRIVWESAKKDLGGLKEVVIKILENEF